MATTEKKYLDGDGLLYYHQKSKGTFVEKESGKGLSTNDYTTAEKTKLAGVETGAQVNKIEKIKVNGTEQTISNKEVNLTINSPTKTSDLTNDSDFQTGTQVSSAIASAISGVTQFDYQVVTALPASGVKGTIYLVAHTAETQNLYDEYLWINDAWEKIGTTQIDLSNYYNKTETDNLLNTKASKATTLAGYGIADAYTKTTVDNTFQKSSELVAITNAEIDAIVAS